MRLERTTWVDWYVDASGESALLVADRREDDPRAGDGRVVVLSVLATCLLEAVDPDTGATLACLSDVLVAAFGGPPDGDAEAATQAAVHHLLTHGVLEEVPSW